MGQIISVCCRQLLVFTDFYAGHLVHSHKIHFHLTFLVSPNENYFLKSIFSFYGSVTKSAPLFGKLSPVVSSNHFGSSILDSVFFPFSAE